MAMPKGAIVAAGRERSATGQFTNADLTDREAAFVRAYIENGGVIVAAAREAGYPHDTEGYRLIRRDHIIKAIARQLLPRTARMAHTATTLIERQLEAWLDLTDRNPEAAASLPTKELRGILALALDRLLPAPKADNDPSVSKGDRSVEELEAELNRARLARADAARMIEGEAEPASPHPSVPSLGA